MAASFFPVVTLLLLLFLFSVPETVAVGLFEHRCIHVEHRVQRHILNNIRASARSPGSNATGTNDGEKGQEEKEPPHTGYEHQRCENARESLQGLKSESRLIRLNIAHHSARPFNKENSNVKAKLKNDVNSREPLRIVVDTSLLVDPTMICTAVGQLRPDFLGSTHTCVSDDIMTVEKLWVIERIALPLAVYRVQQFLNVNPVQKPLLVTKGACGPDVTIPTNHTTVGVFDADMIIYAHAGGMGHSATPGAMGTIAWAAHCTVNDAGRPVVAQMNFVPAFILWYASGWGYDYYVRIVIHEFLHVLGFTPACMEGMVSVSKRRGKLVFLVTTPAVIAAARDYLGCATLDGVELEDEGGTGTAVTHWERREWMDEIMVGIPSRSAISALSLAYFSSLDFYTVNMEYNESIQWGHSAGCPFIEEKCVANSPRMGLEWCNASLGEQLCTFDRTAIGFCNTGSVLNLPTYFQYFPSEPTRGGFVPLMDYCPVVNGYGNLQCSRLAETTENDAIYGFYYGPQSRCVPTDDMFKIGYSGNDKGPRCLRVRCRLGKQLEVFVGSYWLPCPADGGAGVIAIPFYTGYRGKVYCERAELVCSPALFYNPDIPVSASPVDDGPLREYAFDVILVLNTIINGTKEDSTNTLARMATLRQGIFFTALQEDVATLCMSKLGTGKVRLLPEYAFTTLVGGDIAVNFQLGVMVGGGSATTEKLQTMYKNNFRVNSVMKQMGAYITAESNAIFTVTVASAEILPEVGVVDDITSLDQLLVLGEIKLHCKGDMKGMPSLEADEAVKLLGNAVRQDVSQILLFTPNLMEVKRFQITGPTDLLVTFTVSFPPVADGISRYENMLGLWKQLLVNSTIIPSPFPVLTSTVQLLSKGIPVSVMDSGKSSGALSFFSVDVTRVQPESNDDLLCVMQFANCYIVQTAVLVIVVFIVSLMVIILYTICRSLKPKRLPQNEFRELKIPLQERC